jgi:DNA polymerase elongation subunit (family B)
MYGSVYYNKRQSIIQWSEYDKDDVRTEHKEKWVPDFYIDPQNQTGEYKSQEGLDLTRIVEKSWKKRNDLIKEYKEGNRKIYGSDLSPENKFILERWPQDLLVAPKVRYMFIDIETECESGFPEAEKAEERVNLITCWSSDTEVFTTFGLEYHYESPNYHLCRDEEELLEKFIKYVERTRHDIWSGWNSSGFDIPYLFNRILRVLDGIDIEAHLSVLKDYKEASNKDLKEELRTALSAIEENFHNIHRLSHFGVSKKDMKMSRDVFTKEMKPKVGYEIVGVTDYDYLNLDQKYALHKRDSYKLDNVAMDELGEKKVEYDGTIRDLYQKDWKLFVKYNIQDVNLLVRLNQVLNYIPQSIALSYKCHCTFKDNMGTVTKAETSVYNFLFKDKVIMGDRKEHGKDQPSIPGGYVTQSEDLRRGKHKWIIDVDIASLYPSLMRGINISYDTRVAEIKTSNGKNLFECDPDDEVAIINGEIKKTTAQKAIAMIKKKKYHVSARGIIFKNVETDKGVLVKMLDLWYSQRKADKKKEAEYRQKALDVFDNAEEVIDGEKIEENGVTKVVMVGDFDKYNEYMRLKGIHYNLQWSCKILLNSIYGCLGSSFSRFYGEDLASSVTLSGRTVIKHNGEMLNDFFNGEFWDMKVIKKNFPKLDEEFGDVEARLYTDTDSVYLTFDALMNKLGVPQDDKSRLKVTRFLAKIAMNKLEEYNETFFEKKFNAPNSIFWDQELIARTGIWCQPKKYVCHILEENGKPPKEDMLKKGLDIVRSSIPRKFKEYITTAVDMTLKDHTEEELGDYIRNVYSEFKTWDVDDIALPVSCNNLSKWGNTKGLNFLSGSPQHMKAAITFNHYLKHFGLTDYEPIKERDKFKMIFLGKNTDYTVESMGYKDKLPAKMEIESLIDWDRHFERGLIMPLTQIYDALGWRFPEVKMPAEDIDDLFE